MALKKELGTLEVFCIAVGAMISSGLFILPGIAFSKTGPSVFLAYLLAGILAIPSLLSKIELATAMPKAGGSYFFIDRSMGPALGTLGGLASWFSLSFKTAFSLVGIGAFIALLFPGLTSLELRWIAAGLCVFFTIVNLVGVAHVGRFQVVMVLGLIGIIVAYVVGGFGPLAWHRFEGFFTGGPEGLVATTGLVFVSFGGLTKAASVAEEVKDPVRDLPRGMGLAFGVVLLLYTVATFVTVGVVDAGKLDGSLTPINLGAAATIGGVGVIVVTVGALLAFVSTANAGILASSRMPLAMSRDQLMPSTFQNINAKRGTPTVAILATGGFMVAVILLLDVEGLVKTASTLKLLLFVMVNLALIVMRESKLKHYRPSFWSPLYPLPQIIGIIAYSILIAAMGALPLILSGVFIVASFAWYALYGRRSQTKRVSALVHVVERIAGRDLESGTLDAELKEIVGARDPEPEDRFEALLKRCKIVDLAGQPTLEAMFAQVCESMQGMVGVDAEVLERGLLEREHDIPTSVSPTVAIPHMVLPGSGTFEILVARCKEGIRFNDEAPMVQAIFVLIGSEDERNFHLNALLNIAKINLEPGFERDWLEPDSEDELRELLLETLRRAVPQG